MRPLRPAPTHRRSATGSRRRRSLFHDLYHELGRAVSWHRRKLAAVAAVGAVLATVSAALPPDRPSTEVLVTTTALAGGVTLGSTDVTLRRLPEDAVPTGAATDPAAVVGRTLVAPLPANAVLTDLSVLSDRTLADPGLVIAPLRIGDATIAGLLRVGDRVDVVSGATAGSRATVVASDVRVVALPADPGADGLGVTAGGNGGQLVLVAATPEQAAALVDLGTDAGVILH